VLRRGELVNAEKINVESKGARVNDGKLSNEEARTYHERLMKRQYYGKTPPKRSEPF
jgi:polyhydroxyalkanoate synthesis regulator phasin